MADHNSLLSWLDTRVAGDRERFENLLGRMVRIPTVSSDPERRQDIRRGAELAAIVLREFGAQAEIVETPGHPLVWGRMVSGPADPTVTVYNHLDVQPALEPEWRQNPFAFQIQDGRYLGRGTTDDKGPALVALFAARYARDQGIPLNVQFLWELEEEIGSPNFESAIASRAPALRTDSVLVSDTTWISRDVPAIPYGLRGLQGARLILVTAEKDAHSGLTGGAARNPVAELCQIIAACHDARTGLVHIPGFYDDVTEVGEEEMRSFLSSGFQVEPFRQAHGLRSLRAQNPADVIHRIWCAPTFEVHGIVGGYTGPGIKTVVPPRAEAKISMRLVPGQQPAKVLRLLRDFVATLNPDVQVESAGSLEPYLGEFSGPYAEAASRSLAIAFGKTPAFIREGGSIGAVVSMQRHLAAPIVLMGFSLPEHGYHAPNEYFDWGQASGGMKAMALYFSHIAAIPPR